MALGDMISGGAIGSLVGGVAGGPAGIPLGGILGSGTGSNVAGGLGGSLLGGVVGGPAGSVLGALLGSGIVDKEDIEKFLGEDLTDLLTGNLGGLLEGAKGDKAKIEKVPLDPGLQQVVDRARQLQLDELGNIAALRGVDLDKIREKTIERQKIQHELGQLPRMAGLRSQEMAATTGIEDARRRLRERIAQKGLGSSSIGVAAETSLGRQQGRLFEDIKAQREGLARERQLATKAIDLTVPELKKKLELEDMSKRIGMVSGILGVPGARQQTAITGGGPSALGALAPVAGAGIGALFGGAPGGMVGLGAGQAAGAYLG